MPAPDLSTVPTFYHNYVRKAGENDLTQVMDKHMTSFVSVLETIPDERWDHRYAEGKWSIRELVQHVIDAERIFCYRALRFSRKDRTPLPGFDENPYVDASRASRRTRASLLAELRSVQESTLLLFASFDEEHLAETGEANGNPISVNTIGYIIVGHALHHLAVLEERYLATAQ
jgi:hypothetical protein